MEWDAVRKVFAISNFADDSGKISDTIYYLDRELIVASHTRWIDLGSLPPGTVINRQNVSSEDVPVDVPVPSDHTAQGGRGDDVPGYTQEDASSEDGPEDAEQAYPVLTPEFADLPFHTKMMCLLGGTPAAIWDWRRNSCHLDSWAVCELFALALRPDRLTSGIPKCVSSVLCCQNHSYYDFIFESSFCVFLCFVAKIIATMILPLNHRFVFLCIVAKIIAPIIYIEPPIFQF